MHRVDAVIGTNICLCLCLQISACCLVVSHNVFWWLCREPVWIQSPNSSVQKIQLGLKVKMLNFTPILFSISNSTVQLAFHTQINLCQIANILDSLENWVEKSLAENVSAYCVSSYLHSVNYWHNDHTAPLNLNLWGDITSCAAQTKTLACRWNLPRYFVHLAF